MASLIFAAACALICILGAADPVYVLSSSSLCASGSEAILTEAECKLAAESLLLQDTVPQLVPSQLASQHYAGCFKDVSSSLHLNVDGSPGNSMTDRAVCVWRDTTTHTTTTATVTTTTATTVTIADPPDEDGLGYLGSCTVAGMMSGNDVDTIFIPTRNLTAAPALPSGFDARNEWSFCFQSYPVRKQGACGSCWAFAAATVTRHRACIYDCNKNGRCDSSNFLHGREFSVQQIMGCGESRSGCDGGWAFHAYEAMKRRLAFSTDIPYKCGQGSIENQFGGGGSSCIQWPWGTEGHPQVCNVENDHVRVQGHYRLPLQGDAAARAALMAAELMTHGPFAVDFCVRDNFFGFWTTGDRKQIYQEMHGCKHGKSIGGHMATMVGFGTQFELPYWMLENSWSPTWGDNGFFYMERGVNLCGVESKATFPDVTVASVIITSTTTTTTQAPTTQASGDTTRHQETTPPGGTTRRSDVTPIPGGTTTVTTFTVTTIDWAQYVHVDSVADMQRSDETPEDAAPHGVVLAALVVLLVLCLGSTFVALGLWSRYNRLRVTMRSDRPNFIPGISTRSPASGFSATLTENRQDPESNLPPKQPPQMMGQPGEKGKE